MQPEIIDWPKTPCPFVRETINGHYVVTPKIAEGMEWVFKDAGVKAVDKLHGTNICVIIENKTVVAIDNRDTRVLESPQIKLNGGNSYKFMMGVINALEKGWITEDGRYYGELIGHDINGNIHGCPDYLFVPFGYLEKKCHWLSFIKNRYPKDFESLSEWFRHLPSVFSERLYGIECFSEGLIFLHPDGRRAKLRRDMFDWYNGPRHKN